MLNDNEAELVSDIHMLHPFTDLISKRYELHNLMFSDSTKLVNLRKHLKDDLIDKNQLNNANLFYMKYPI